jgi:hypothetical protein
MGTLLILLLRLLLLRPIRRVGCLLMGASAVASGTLLLVHTLAANLPRPAAAAMIGLLAAAWFFLRSSWRQWRRRRSGIPPVTRQPF